MMPATKGGRALSTRFTVALVGLSLFLAACEDEGNQGDDNLLTGASVVVVVVIVLAIGFMVIRRRGDR